MTRSFDAEAHALHMASVMELPLDPAWLPTVISTMAATAAIAATVMEFPLADEIEPAEVFEP